MPEDFEPGDRITWERPHQVRDGRMSAKPDVRFPAGKIRRIIDDGERALVELDHNRFSDAELVTVRLAHCVKVRTVDNTVL